jgi:hypothetical protein
MLWATFIATSKNSYIKDPRSPSSATSHKHQMPYAATTTNTSSSHPKQVQAVLPNKPTAAAAIDPATLLDRFVSFTFSEVRIDSCVGKAWNVHVLNKRLLALVSKVVPINKYVRLFVIVMLFLLYWDVKSGEKIEGNRLTLTVVAVAVALVWLIDSILTLWFFLTLDPLMVLVEARDAVGKTTLFYIRDGRSRMDRVMGWRCGGRMELVDVRDPDTPLLVTRVKPLGLPGLLCCCCCFCFFTSDIYLERCRDGICLATYSVLKCFGYSDIKEPFYNDLLWQFFCREPTVNTIHCGTGTVCLEEPYVKPSFGCCDNDGHSKNVIGPDNVKCDHRSCTVKRNGFTWSDYLLDSAEIFGEDVGEVADAVAAVQEAGQVISDYQNDLQAFKEQGYEKVGTSKSIWEVTLPPGMSDADKYGVLLYVMKQYAYPEGHEYLRLFGMKCV